MAKRFSKPTPFEKYLLEDASAPPGRGSKSLFFEELKTLFKKGKDKFLICTVLLFNFLLNFY